jgi:hypothetical protein
MLLTRALCKAFVLDSLSGVPSLFWVFQWFSLHSRGNLLCYGCDFVFAKATVLLLLELFGKSFAYAFLGLCFFI